ncbi:AMP-binding protein [Lacticaseibacillus baoqingensis]|uniref:AMP-binding protein n=1 Tax=Lacticaseibacillus baoqingensis TaxID=2486013 RepID=A0ABW4EBZ4_9LACO|nr:AMP-binding protein [Lacticaseibacillus baoqingensis]
MTQLTTLLSNQLKNNLTRSLVKDTNYPDWFTGKHLQQDVLALHTLFVTQKLGHGDQLLVCLPNSAAFLVINQAAWELGIIVHPISPTTPIPELIAADHEQHYPMLLLTPELAAGFAAPDFGHETLHLNTAALSVVKDCTQLDQRTSADRSPVQEDDLGLILNTSGTTGQPKQVGLSQRILLNAARHDAASNHMTPKDTAMITMPMFHINAQVMSTLSSRVANARIVITPQFSASQFWPQVQANHVTWVSVVPTIISFLLLNEQANAAYGRLQAKIALRFVRSSSFALPKERLQAFQARFHTLVIEGYGMTESASQCTTNPHDAPKIGSAGLPYGTEVKLVVADQFTAAPGVLGEIAIRGDHVITHYLDDANPESFKAGWFLTGDLGYFDEDGYLFVKGRKKEIISRGGEKVAPAHVESVLSALPFIEQLAVIGMPDPLYGEAVTAVVVSTTPGLNQAAQAQQLLAYGQAQLAKFETPTQVEFIREFPRNPTGKILRAQLRDQLLAIGANA